MDRAIRMPAAGLASLIIMFSCGTLAIGETMVCTAAAYRDGNLELVKLDLTDGTITRIGSAMSPRVHGIVLTNDGQLFGTNFWSDALYSIDPSTGLTSSVGSSRWQLTGGLAYDHVNDIIYTLGAAESGGDKFLLSIDRTTGSASAIAGASGTPGLSSTSGLAWDSANSRLIAFDNADDEFYAFDTDGNGTKLSDAMLPEGANNSWSLAHDGTNVIMQLVGFSGNDEIRFLNPDTGQVVGELKLSEAAPMEALDCSISAVPEPAGYLLASSALLLMLALTRRKRINS